MASVAKTETLQEQRDRFEALLAEAEEIGAPINSFFHTMYMSCKERIDEGKTEPLSAQGATAFSYQERVNEKTRNAKGIAKSVYGNVEVEEPEDEPEEPTVSSVRYVPGQVIGGDFVFGPDSGLTHTPNETNLPEGDYVVELKAGDGVEIITSARRSVAAAPYKKEGDPANVVFAAGFGRGTEQAVHIPVIDPTFYVMPHIETFASMLYAESQKKPQKVMVSGPQGTGKTSMIQQLAARHNRNFFLMSCGMIESPAEWFGFRDVQDGNIVYVPSAFIEACETPNSDILLDEYNRLHTTLQNGLYNILDDNGEAWVDMVKRNIRVAAGVMFWATANIGAAHTGTFQIDAAMEDRFNYHLKMDYLPQDDEIRVLCAKTGIGKSVAADLVRVALKIREGANDDNSVISKPISFRQLESAATLIVQGMKPIQAVEFTIFPKFSSDGGDASELTDVKKIVQGILAKKSGR